jgi:hypothetical protein
MHKTMNSSPKTMFEPHAATLAEYFAAALSKASLFSAVAAKNGC